MLVICWIQLNIISFMLDLANIRTSSSSPLSPWRILRRRFRDSIVSTRFRLPGRCIRPWATDH
ncbi:hypothetical protein PF005_g18676 [Phytophthora fragariae]|uniref:RxLR effector protein n=1 Tax=Phytophthora fragariae TaxID=53985 RepID=A0A6A3EGK3_9STRA|nr:hypothetical protein PF003_g3960 [Phytophthora fragariae]KAE8930310.1 hypothetical protein PF009_g19593 [Phytophthora fragariae]KAE8996131.1 hypothetical protein PF011_g16035 [Phytophthora fragariae]KAE9121185.1 hypothetical protein PF006_g17957 [Phytophthora fragariae]KAE9191876.1 hypothetical protein PF005_g18676 [Phytophthora fragariae]